MRTGIVVAALAALFLTACGGGESRAVGSFLDPYCAPDGSVVFRQYANSQGEYDGGMASRENCTWYKGN